MLLDALFSTRDLGRFVDIVGVLTRHGLGDLVQRMGWTDALERAGQSLRWEHAADLARLPRPVQLRMALEELGPTFVKLGQILAGRADLIGPDTIAELEKLHSRVPALPLEALRPQMREDLGDEPEAVFAHFDPEPLAAASIAQVHRARLHDGTEVVVKVRRPGISEVIDADLRLLERLAGIAEARMPSLKPYRPQGLVREFGRSLRRELDLAGECHNAERIAANLAPLGFVTIPQVVWAHTRSRINVQHFVGAALGRAEHLHGLLGALDGDLVEHHGRRLGHEVGSNHCQKAVNALLLVGQGAAEGFFCCGAAWADNQVNVGNFVAVADQRFANQQSIDLGHGLSFSCSGNGV